jgi:hypothetical protein
MNTLSIFENHHCGLCFDHRKAHHIEKFIFKSVWGLNLHSMAAVPSDTVIADSLRQESRELSALFIAFSEVDCYWILGNTRDRSFSANAMRLFRN